MKLFLKEHALLIFVQIIQFFVILAIYFLDGYFTDRFYSLDYLSVLSFLSQPEVSFTSACIWILMKISKNSHRLPKWV
ncbi:hypothetical protein NST54_12290 [Caldifermentibacillus hisashii]